MISRLNRRHKARHPRPGGGKEGKNVGHLLEGVTDDSTVNVEASESGKKKKKKRTAKRSLWARIGTRRRKARVDYLDVEELMS